MKFQIVNNQIQLFSSAWNHHDSFRALLYSHIATPVHNKMHAYARKQAKSINISFFLFPQLQNEIYLSIKEYRIFLR